MEIRVDQAERGEDGADPEGEEDREQPAGAAQLDRLAADPTWIIDGADQRRW